MAKKSILVPEFVPRPLWGRSASKMLRGKSVWLKQIRPNAIARAKDRCEICKSDSIPLVCHDKWSYNDLKAIATLIEFEIHCRACDAVTHFGRLAGVVGVEQALSQVIQHLCSINKCGPDLALETLQQRLDEWELRNSKRWTIAVTPKLAATYPVLSDLPSFIPSLKD